MSSQYHEIGHGGLSNANIAVTTVEDAEVFTKDEQAWDDSIIMEIFNEAVSNHELFNKTGGSSNKRQKKSSASAKLALMANVSKEQLLTQAMPGQWAAVPVPAPAVCPPQRDSETVPVKHNNLKQQKHVQFSNDAVEDGEEGEIVEGVFGGDYTEHASSSSNPNHRSDASNSGGAVLVDPASSASAAYDLAVSNHSSNTFSVSGIAPADLDKALTEMIQANYQAGYAAGKYYTLLELSRHAGATAATEATEATTAPSQSESHL